MVAFADTRSTMQAADVLVKIHSKAIGIEPGSGDRYDANDPKSQLWIHLTAWHSILYAYERYGPGRLPADEEARYWNECAIAAELQTCDPADVPRTREGIREYFENMRPQLRASEVAKSTMEHLLHAEVMLPPHPRVLKPMTWVISRALRRATIATMPGWMREMSGFRQSRLIDALIRPGLRLAFWLGQVNSRVELRMLQLITPATVGVVAPILRGVPPLRPETLTPAQARERYGYARPAQAYPEWRAKQYARVFDQGTAPDDAGLIESEPILGSLA
jgi:uncharacterized protein (DUF2236 family)